MSSFRSLCFLVSSWTITFSQTQTTIWSQDMTNATLWDNSSPGTVKFNSAHQASSNCDVGNCLLIYDNGIASMKQTASLDLTDYTDIKVEFTLRCVMDATCYYFEYSINGGQWTQQFSIGNTGKHQRTESISAANNAAQFRIRFRMSCNGGNNDDCWTDSLYVKGIGTPSPTTSQPTTSNPTSIPTTSNPTTSMPTTSNPTTSEPTTSPTNNPSKYPSKYPTQYPSKYPSKYPTTYPTNNPSKYPTISPTFKPSETPTKFPTKSSNQDGAAGQETTISNTAQFNLNEPRNELFVDNPILIPIALATIVLLIVCICALLICFFKRKKNNKRHIKNEEGIELTKVRSVSTGGGTQGQIVSAETDYEEEAETETKTTTNEEIDPYSDRFALKMWLQNINLLCYYDLFISEGFGDQMSTLKALTGEDLQRLGITKLAHRKAIMVQIENNNGQIEVMNEGGMIQNTTHYVDDDENDNDNDDLFAPQPQKPLQFNTPGNEEITTTGGNDTNTDDGLTDDNDNEADNDDEYEYYYEKENNENDEAMYQKGTSTKQ